MAKEKRHHANYALAAEILKVQKAEEEKARKVRREYVILATKSGAAHSKNFNEVFDALEAVNNGYVNDPDSYGLTDREVSDFRAIAEAVESALGIKVQNLTPSEIRKHTLAFLDIH